MSPDIFQILVDAEFFIIQDALFQRAVKPEDVVGDTVNDLFYSGYLFLMNRADCDHGVDFIFTQGNFLQRVHVQEKNSIA
jgi:hypothetical protein